MAHSESSSDGWQLVTPRQLIEAVLEWDEDLTPIEVGNPRKDCDGVSEAVWLATEDGEEWPMDASREIREAALEGLTAEAFADAHLAKFAPEARQEATYVLATLFEEAREEEATREPTPCEACGVEPGTVEAKER